MQCSQRLRRSVLLPQDGDLKASQEPNLNHRQCGLYFSLTLPAISTTGQKTIFTRVADFHAQKVFSAISGFISKRNNIAGVRTQNKPGGAARRGTA